MRPVSPHVFQISLGAVNCFVIEESNGELTLVDTGYENSTAKIFKAIEAGGRSPKSIKRVILTHSHPDHAGSAAEIVNQTGATLYMHPEDAALAVKGVAGRLPHNVSPGLVNKIVFRLFIKNSPNRIPAFVTNRMLNHGDVLPIAGGIHVIHTPGHSAGHIVLYVQKDDLLIAGDLCANMMGIGLSTVYEDRELGIRSILKVTEQRFEKAVFGHGKPIVKNAWSKIREKFAV